MESTRAPILDPIDRNSEVLFGLFMVLTFTGTLSVATAGREDVRQMLIAALGCNIAWGFVDGVMYVLRSIVARGRHAAQLRAVRAASTDEAHRLLAEELPGLAAGVGTAALEQVRQWVLAQPEPAPLRLQGDDLRGAFGVFLLVFLSTIPAVLPFLLMSDLRAAMRVSGAVAIAIMFACGYSWGQHAGMPPLRVGIVMVLLGVVVESVVIALGG